MTSPNWLIYKNATINPKNNVDRRFQYALTLNQHYEEIENNRQWVSKIKPFIDHYNWDGIDYPASSNNFNKFDINNSDA